MRCPACNNENPRYPKVPYCDVCGADLNPGAPRATAYEPTPAAPPASGAAPLNPSQKRRTVFEPPPAAGAPATPPAPVRDFFSNPPPPRPPLNPKDPFQATQPPAPQPAAGPRPKAATVIAAGPAGAARTVRGAFFAYRGPADEGRVLPLRAGRNVIGRDPGCDVALEDDRVSTQHAYLFLRAEDATFMDVSTNGSRVDGQVVNGEQVTLRHGAVLEVGGLTLVFVMVPEALLAGAGKRS